MDSPRISIVTPSYNQDQYLEQTILSVIGQNYPNLEYIIIDGGSSDNSVEIIKKYEKYIKYWISEPDQGQSYAINKGFQQATGDIIAWLNSDDLYMPGILERISREINPNETGIYLGECLHFKKNIDFVECRGSDVGRSFNEIDLFANDYIIQPATFWTKKTWETVGSLKEDLNFGFDWEWFLRAKTKKIPFYPMNIICSLYRIHDAHKSCIGLLDRQKELLNIYKLYNPKMAKLYTLLMNEAIFMNSSFNLLTRLGFLFKFQSLINDGKKLKLLKYFKYISYSSSEINLVRKML